MSVAKEKNFSMQNKFEKRDWKTFFFNNQNKSKLVIESSQISTLYL